MEPVKWYTYIKIALISAVCAFGLTFLFNLLGLVEDSSYADIAANQFFGQRSLFEVIGIYCLITPIAEEFIFRFLGYNMLMKYLPNKHVVALFISLLFGIYHLNLIQGVYAFLMSLVITYSYMKYHKFAVPVVAHISANAVALFYTFIAMH